MDDAAKKEGAGKVQEAAAAHPDTTPSNASKETAHPLLRSLHELLRGYERQHYGKVPGLQGLVDGTDDPVAREGYRKQISDTQAKARRNGDMASRIERWLEANPPLHGGVESWLREQVPLIFDREVAAHVPPRAEWPPEMVAEFNAVADLVVAMLAPLYAMVGDAQEAGVVEAQDARNGMLACDIVMVLVQHFQHQGREALAQPVTMQ